MIDLRIPHISDWGLTAPLEDEFRTLWIGTENTLYRRWSDGRLNMYRPRALPASNYWTLNLRRDHEGRILASTSKGLWIFKPTETGICDERLFRHKPGARTDFLYGVIRRPDHTLWAVLYDGISRSFPEAPQREAFLFPITSSIGLDDFYLEAVAEDRDGNVWIGSDGGGASRIARNGFVTFSEADGLASHDIVSVLETHAGNCLQSAVHPARYSSIDSQTEGSGRFASTSLLNGLRRFGTEHISW